ncbi:MAG: L-rhamnose isomerase [Lachnospirales bacterium]
MSYLESKRIYEKFGIDTEKAIEELNNISISIHCWQGDDVTGFEGSQNLTGGIQATGNYMGKASTPEELMADLDKALELIPGTHRINLHANYAIFDDGFVDRDKLEPKHFKKWVDYAKERNLGIDFNPTYFSHEKAEGATLSSENEEIRSFWVEHGKTCLKISEYFANELNTYCSMNIWIPDGFKDIPADRRGPRLRLKKSLDEILSIDYDKSKVYVAVESKVFGIGLESCTVGSSEFYMNYAMQNNIMCLIDNGHYNVMEDVADKISTMLIFNEKLALHVTRPVRWDSDHVVLFDDTTKEIAKEIIRNGSEKILLALDFFDASINRISAWVTGTRNMQKSLLNALLLPNEELSKLQDERNFTKLMVLNEEMKTMPFGDIWREFCQRNNTLCDGDWFKEIEEYEAKILSER